MKVIPTFIATGCLIAASAHGVALEPSTESPTSPRELYNLGTRQLHAGKLREAEAAFESSLSFQKETLQPPALYNLGHVRFGVGREELKKGPAAGPSVAQGKSANQDADEALKTIDDALANEDVQKLVAAYMRGRGARKELRSASQAVKAALKSYGAALGKWQRSSGDFKSTVELAGNDPDAQANADTVDQCIAKLIDSIQQMQQMASAMGNKGDELKEKMKRIKGRLPAENMPPGAAGDDDEEEDMPNGQKQGVQEGKGKEGEQMTLSPEQAGWLLNGFKLDSEHRLPMGQESTAQPKDRSGRTW